MTRPNILLISLDALRADHLSCYGYDRHTTPFLDELAAHDGIRREDFFRAPWEECFYDGRQYAIPYDTDVRVLYYNKALFRQAGLDPDRPPKTWSEMREYSRKLTRRRDDVRIDIVGFSFMTNPHRGHHWDKSLALQHADHFDLN